MDLRERPISASFTRHPWEETRARFFGDLVLEELGAARALRVLDVGAGDGYLAGQLLPRLATGSSVDCWDSNYDQSFLDVAPPCPGLRFSQIRPQGRFDLVLLLDVLEHVADDVAFVRNLVAGSMADEAVALISAPAWMGLFTQHDVRIGHRRRYRPAELEALARSCGLLPTCAGPLFCSLLLARGLTKIGELARGVRSSPLPDAPPARAETDLGRWRAGTAVTWTVRSALALDAKIGRLLARARVPVPGLSAWLLARRAPVGGRP